MITRKTGKEYGRKERTLIVRKLMKKIMGFHIGFAAGVMPAGIAIQIFLNNSNESKLH
jgi:uncharacterized membrane protein YfcA